MIGLSGGEGLSPNECGHSKNFKNKIVDIHTIFNRGGNNVQP